MPFKRRDSKLVNQYFLFPSRFLVKHKSVIRMPGIEFYPSPHLVSSFLLMHTLEGGTPGDLDGFLSSRLLSDKALSIAKILESEAADEKVCLFDSVCVCVHVHNYSFLIHPITVTFCL